MSRVKLTIATTDYDHFRDFRLGITNAEGIDHTWLTLGHHEVFARFTFNREWDVSELSFAKFCAQVTRPTPDIIGLPVVCSRLFRFSSFYVNRHSKIKTVADLKGKTIGSPEWAHTAAVYMRGWLNDEHGVGLKDISGRHGFPALPEPMFDGGEDHQTAEDQDGREREDQAHTFRSGPKVRAAARPRSRHASPTRPTVAGSCSRPLTWQGTTKQLTRPVNLSCCEQVCGSCGAP